MAGTPQQVAAKWKDRLVASRQQIIDGVNAVTTAPGQKAAAQKQLWLQRIQQSADKWATNVARVSLEDWKNSMINVGVDRVGTGANAKVGKVESFMGEFLPYVTAGADRVNSMPKGDLSASIARATAMIQHNANFKRTGR